MDNYVQLELFDLNLYTSTPPNTLENEDEKEQLKKNAECIDYIQLELNLFPQIASEKSLVENQQKVRGKNPKISATAQKFIKQLLVKVERNEIPLEEVRLATYQFLILVEGAK